ncbi:MAG: hypothetical protein Ct9H300mP24_5670 [Candidatus Neomarinimicrobiota bacterium]|nr:MAG: hypothetical protein Ct9H300mP24_5670 [Candidatus Neomarinimicrobiota bacterium]
MKKTFEKKGIDLISLYGISDQNITFIEQYLPVSIDIRGDSFFCKGLKKKYRRLFSSIKSYDRIC